MARACPSCSRPNGDRAAKCLYCSAPFEPLVADDGSPAQSSDGEPEPVESPAESKAGHLVILPASSAEPPTDAVVGRYADLAGISSYDARLALSSSRARVVRRFELEEGARALSEAMAAASIPHLLVSEDRVRSMAIAHARRIRFGERHFEIVIEDRASTFLYEELLLLVRGEIVRASHDEKRLGTSKNVTRRLTSGLLLHLYRRDAQLAIEIDPERFTWPETDGETSPSAIVNLERLIRTLRDRAPHATLDRDFDLEPEVLSRAGGEGELSHMLADGGRGPKGVVYDNGEQFRFYSRWRYQLEQHLERG